MFPAESACVDLEIATSGVGTVRRLGRWLVYGICEFVGVVVSPAVLPDASHDSIPCSALYAATLRSIERSLAAYWHVLQFLPIGMPSRFLTIVFSGVNSCPFLQCVFGAMAARPLAGLVDSYTPQGRHMWRRRGVVNTL